MLDVVAALDTTDETDSYTVTLVAGVTYFIEVDGDSYGDDRTTLTLNDPMVHLVGPDGTEVAFNDDLQPGAHQDGRIVFTASVSGDYTVQIEAFKPGQTGTYRLTVAPDDLRGTVWGAGDVGAVAQGGQTLGSLDYAGSNGFDGDIDLFAVQLSAGLTYHITVRGAGSGQGTLDQARVQVLDSLGGVVRTATGDAGSDLEFAFTPAVGGSLYYLAVKDAAQGDGGTFQIALSVGRGTAGDDVVSCNAIDDLVQALGGNDFINLWQGNDAVQGGTGNDTLLGDLGNDDLSGGAGDDRLRGGYDDDTLLGESGGDRLNGGWGADRFTFTSVTQSSGQGCDTIVSGGFDLGFEGAGVQVGDLMDLSAIDADAGLVGMQGLIFDGSEGLGHVWLVEKNGHTIVKAETGASQGLDFRLVIQDGAVLASAYVMDDFVL